MNDEQDGRRDVPPSPPNALRLSKQTREQIATLKRRTQIRHMNVLCRWALCRSLQESVPPPQPSADVAVEIDWSIFAGAAGQLWWSLILESSSPGNALVDAAEAEWLLRAHVSRGMAYLVGDLDIRDVTSLARSALAK